MRSMCSSGQQTPQWREKLICLKGGLLSIETWMVWRIRPTQISLNSTSIDGSRASYPEKWLLSSPQSLLNPMHLLVQRRCLLNTSKFRRCPPRWSELEHFPFEGRKRPSPIQPLKEWLQGEIITDLNGTWWKDENNCPRLKWERCRMDIREHSLFCNSPAVGQVSQRGSAVSILEIFQDLTKKKP